jgi:Flp pilus assembly protein TadD
MSASTRIPNSEIRNPNQVFGFRISVFVLGVLLAGCEHLEPLPVVAPPALPAAESAPKLTAAQVADVKIAYGRTLEKRGAPDQARATYLEALKLDSSRADACARLGVLCDQQCKFDEANSWHCKAVAGQPKNPDFQCNAGYSLYLQGNLIEAEKSLRKCLELAPEHARGHNNLGMILGRMDRCQEALAEFHRAGCNEADAQANLAYALTLERRWAEAEACYQRALAADPSSTASLKGLQELHDLMAKADPSVLVHGSERDPAGYARPPAGRPVENRAE